MCERDVPNCTEEKRMSAERLFLCAIWDVPFAHPAISRVQFGTSLMHISFCTGAKGVVNFVAFLCGRYPWLVKHQH